MFTYLVLEPSVFSGVRFEADPRYGADVARLLRAVHCNGVLLLDSSDDLLRRILAEMSTIPPKHRQRVLALFEELYRDARGMKRVVTCSQHLTSGSGCDTTRMVASLVRDCGADAAIAPDEARESILNHGIPEDAVVQPASYEDSAAENRRLSYMQQVALSHLPAGDAEDLFRRVFRFARWLRIYDKQIGKGGNITGFRTGIDYLLTQWRQHAHEPLSDASVEIVTATATSPKPSDSPSKKRQIRQSNAEPILKVERQIIAPLRNKHSVRISLEVREDPEHEWHARFYETNLGVLKVDPGADIVKRSGDFKHVYLDHAGQHHEDLVTIYNLPRISYRPDGSWQLDS